MKGLLLKDTFIIVKENRYFLLLAAVMACMQNEFFYSYIIIYAAALPYAALAYDERVNWNRMAETLPVTKAQIIGSKYLVGYLSVTAAAVMAIIGQLLGIAFHAKPFQIQDVNVTLLVVCMALAMQALHIPLMFWIGVERGRLLFVLIMVSAAVGASSIWERISVRPAVYDPNLILAAAFGLTAAANLISFYVAQRLYPKEK